MLTLSRSQQFVSSVISLSLLGEEIAAPTSNPKRSFILFFCFLTLFSLMIICIFWDYLYQILGVEGAIVIALESALECYRMQFKKG